MLEPDVYQDLVGVPYREGGRDLLGLDCWGLLMEMGRRLGIEIPDAFATRAQAKTTQLDFGSSEACVRALFGDWILADPGAGRVAVFADVDGVAMHVGMMISVSDFIHATKRAGVLVQRIDRQPWAGKLMGIYDRRT